MGAVGEDEVGAGRAEVPEVGEFNALFIADALEGGDIGGRDGEDHALLGFADPDFGVGEAVVLEGSAVEVDVRAEFSTHFADGGGEAACAAVGDGGEEGGGRGIGRVAEWQGGRVRGRRR